MDSLKAAQIRAGRGLVDWTQGHLAKVAGVSLSTVKDFEAGRRLPHLTNLAAIRLALELSGVEFIEQNGGGPGVRLRSTGAP